MKLGLGTVQLGMRYGVANPPQPPSRGEVAAILSEAAAAGVEVLDTAPSYGESEARIGALAPPDARFRIVTKTPTDVGDRAEPAAAAKRLVESLRASLSRLRVPAVDAVLEHRPASLLGPGGAARFDALLALRERGLARRVGVSVYDAEALRAIAARFPVQVVQAPVSVLDQRLLESGDLARLRDAGVEVHARSVLLQGLLALAPEALPAGFAALREPLARFRREAAGRGLSPLEAALGFVAGLAEVDVVLCGAVSRAQLGELVQASRTPVEREWLRGFALSDRRLLDPSRWAQAS